MRQVTRTRRRRPWVWVLLVALVLLVNLAVSMSFVLVADHRMTAIEQRIDLTMQEGERWKGELTTAQSELGRELEDEVAELRSELAKLRREVGADEGDLQSVQEVVDALGGRVGRIESMVAALWGAPGSGARFPS